MQLNLDYCIELNPLYCLGFHFQLLNVGISYLEKEEVRVLLRQVSLTSYYCCGIFFFSHLYVCIWFGFVFIF